MVAAETFNLLDVLTRGIDDGLVPTEDGGVLMNSMTSFAKAQQHVVYGRGIGFIDGHTLTITYEPMGVQGELDDIGLSLLDGVVDILLLLGLDASQQPILEDTPFTTGIDLVVFGVVPVGADKFKTRLL
jgi:hypothetical protein